MPNEDQQQAFLHTLLEHEILFAWKPQYNLGIPIIDEQHHGIVTTINSLYFGIQHEQGKSMLEPVIGMVTEYTRIHFETEENFLRICDFPDLEAHLEMHNVLRRSLSTIGEKCLQDQNPLEFLEFLKNWFIDHICQKDRKFKEFLLEMTRF